MAKKLSKAKVDYIKRNYGKQALCEIADRLDIAHETVRHYALKLGLREVCKRNQRNYRRNEYPDYIPGQRIKIPTQSGDKSWTRITRNATVLEVYKEKLHVLLAIDGQYPGVQLRYDVSYFDLWANRAVVI